MTRIPGNIEGCPCESCAERAADFAKEVAADVIAGTTITMDADDAERVATDLIGRGYGDLLHRVTSPDRSRVTLKLAGSGDAADYGYKVDAEGYFYQDETPEPTLSADTLTALEYALRQLEKVHAAMDSEIGRDSDAAEAVMSAIRNLETVRKVEESRRIGEGF